MPLCEGALTGPVQTVIIGFVKGVAGRVGVNMAHIEYLVWDVCLADRCKLKVVDCNYCHDICHSNSAAMLYNESKMMCLCPHYSMVNALISMVISMAYVSICVCYIALTEPVLQCDFHMTTCSARDTVSTLQHILCDKWYLFYMVWHKVNTKKLFDA